MSIRKQRVSEWLKDERIVILSCDKDGFSHDKVVDEYEFWITIGYHATVMRARSLSSQREQSIKEIAALKLKEYLSLATKKEKENILSGGIRYIPIKALM